MAHGFFISCIRTRKLNWELQSILALLCISVHIFVLHLGALRPGGHAASQGWTVLLFRGGGHRKVSSSPKLLFSLSIFYLL